MKPFFIGMLIDKLLIPFFEYSHACIVSIDSLENSGHIVTDSPWICSEREREGVEIHGVCMLRGRGILG